MRARCNLMLTLALGLLLPSGAAQGQVDATATQAVELIDLLNDIDKMRVLNPLKLTERQLDNLIRATRDAQAAYNAKLKEAAVPALQAMADEIRAAHKAALAGGEVPKAFDDKVKRLQADLLRRRDREDEKAIEALMSAVKTNLSAAQLKTATSLAKTLGEAKGTEEELTRFFVMRTLILYPRAVKLLEEMRKAIGSPGAAP